MTTSPPKIAFEFQQITKVFGPLRASDAVSFQVEAGSIHGVVGENGAGKSTIMKILYGLYQPDGGRILIDGEPTRVPSPERAIEMGIGMVHQHFMLVPTLPVWQNVILGREPSRWRLSLGPLDRKSVCARINELQRHFGFSLDLDATVQDLTVGHQQQVEILKLLYREASILILDEPTAVLTPQEVVVLFEKLKELQRLGKTICLITHKLKEILSFTDRVTVMRRGKVVETVPTSELDESRLAEKIVGRKMAPVTNPRTTSSPARAVVEVRNLSVSPQTRGSSGIRDLSLLSTPAKSSA